MHDVAAKRAHRRLRSAVMRNYNRFRPYNHQTAETVSASISQRTNSQLVNRLDILATAAYSAHRISTTANQSSLHFTLEDTAPIAIFPQYIPSAIPTANYPLSLHWAPQPSHDIGSEYGRNHICATTPESSGVRSLSLMKAAPNGDGFSLDDDGMTNQSPPSSPPNAFVPFDTAGDDSVQPFPGQLNDSGTSECEGRDPVDRCISGDGSSTWQGVAEPHIAEEAASHFQFRLDTSFEPDSDMESDLSNAQSEEESENGPTALLESDHALARAFLERTWSRQCDCREGISTASDGQNVFSLRRMTEYWRGLGVPDSIGTASAVSEADEVEDEDEGRNINTNTELDWSAILSGGDDRPILNIEMSQDGAPAIERTWDVDSIIS